MALELQYGEVIRSGGAQIRVSLSGFEADVAVDVKLLQPGGFFTSVSSMLRPMEFPILVQSTFYLNEMYFLNYSSFLQEP